MNSNVDLINYLATFISDGRWAKFNKVIDDRTKHITVVLEDLYQPHNASAVLRSCDCYGVQDIHIVENKNKFSVNQDISLGSAKWLSLHKYKQGANNSLDCIHQLKSKGYKIICTTPHKDDCNLDQLEINSKTALVFGTELTGISKDFIENADGFIKIPMYGFTESFNISVAVALCLQVLITKLRALDIEWTLNKEEKEAILLQWLRNTVKSSDLIEKDYYLNKICTFANINKK